MNQELLDTMHATELDDWGRFGKIRQAEEKGLRDPDDVFIHAEERRRELARQRKKPPALKRSKTLRSQPGTIRKSKRSSSRSVARRMRRWCPTLHCCSGVTPTVSHLPTACRKCSDVRAPIMLQQVGRLDIIPDELEARSQRSALSKMMFLAFRAVCGTNKRRSKNLIKTVALSSWNSSPMRVARAVSKPDDFGTVDKC